MQALIFYRSVKAGVLLGMEQGSGFVIARRACGGGNRAPAARCPHTRRRSWGRSSERTFLLNLPAWLHVGGPWPAG